MRPNFTSQAAAALIAVVGGAAVLAACDSGPSALPARDHSRAAMDEAARQVAERPRTLERRAAADTPTIDGKAIWAANRKHTAQENAEYQFGRNGEAFGAKSLDVFVAKAHGFVTDPPKGVLTLKRANGDRLLYDPKGNVFAVATKDGVPRTMFKPDDGQAYWEKQKAREAQYADKSRRNGDDRS